MKSVKNWPNSLKVLAIAWGMLAALCVALAITGCTTVIPQQPESPSASFDDGIRNSGLVGWTNVDLMTVGIITPRALARYNSLIETYGKRFNPPLNQGEGTCTTCISNLILIQAQDLEHFIRMNRWRMSEAK